MKSFWHSSCFLSPDFLFFLQGLPVYWLHHNCYTSHPLGILSYSSLVCFVREEAQSQRRCAKAGRSPPGQSVARSHLPPGRHSRPADCYPHSTSAVSAMLAGDHSLHQKLWQIQGKQTAFDQLVFAWIVHMRCNVSGAAFRLHVP